MKTEEILKKYPCNRVLKAGKEFWSKHTVLKIIQECLSPNKEVSDEDKKQLYSDANDLIVERLFRFYDLKPSTREAIINAMIDFYFMRSRLTSKEAKSDAVEFAEWIYNYSWSKIDKGWLNPKSNGSQEYLSTQELYSIFKQQSK